MKTYVIVLKVNPWDEDQKPYHMSTLIHCDDASEALRMAMDDEGGSWDWKRSSKEVISLTLCQ